MRKSVIAFAAFLFAAFSAQAQTNVLLDTGRVGIKTLSPTHSLTLGYASSGIAIYNTPEPFTPNYERFIAAWSSNVFQLRANGGGSGTTRAIAIGIGATTTLMRSITITGTSSPSGVVRLDYGTVSSATSGIGAFGTFSASTPVTQNAYAIVPTVNQTNTVAAGYRAFWVSPWESSLGSGVHYLIDAGTNNAAAGAGTHTSRFTLDNAGNGYFAGNVGIGTTTPDAALAVNGKIHAKQVVVDLDGWPDYVFGDTYKLAKLSEVEGYIDRNHHLPGMPEAKEVHAGGLDVGEMNKLLVKKVEELTLYLIEKDKLDKKRDALIRTLKRKVSRLEAKK